jgi:DDE superfamily endonuclease
MPLSPLAQAFLFGEGGAMLAMQVCMLTYACWLFFPNPRGPSFFEQRLAWDHYCSKHEQRGTLKRRIRMDKCSFDKLLGYIYQDLIVKEGKADNRGGPIIPELCLFCTLRYLAGGSYLDICDIAGISKSSFYRILWKTIDALCKCEELAIRFPSSSAEIQSAIEGFESISYASAIRNCALVIDGYLVRIRTPTKEEVGNVRSYFSGHYQCYGVNVQAATDHHSRFVFLSFASPGVTGDRYAIRHCNLHSLIEGLPLGICAIGDAAYEASEHCVPVYHGVDRLKAKYDNFNFFASQLRIRVEMGFGMMQAKWGILQRPLQCKLVNAKDMVQAIGRLHNFVIDERLLAKGELDKIDERSPGYMPSVPLDENGDPIDTEAVFAGVHQRGGHSQLREQMAERVETLGLERPVSNRLNRNYLKRKHCGD